MVPGSNELRKVVYGIKKDDDNTKEMDVMKKNNVTEKFFEYGGSNWDSVKNYWKDISAT